MKKPPFWLLSTITCIFLFFTIGLFLGRSASSAPVLVSVPKTTAPSPPITMPPTEEAASDFPVNINTADKATLTLLPGIGPVYAQRILDYRELNGPFHKPEELLNIPGIGPATLEPLLDLITVGG